MSDIAIKIENLGKRYRYGAVTSVNTTLRADLTDWARGLWPRRSQQSEISNQPPGLTSDLRPPISASQPTSDVRPLTSEPHPTLHQIHEKHLDADPSYFWALKDINLEVRQGEVVGIIGRNGAGKSTLLKILSRVTPPTTGKISYHGRMASLLEVGTGFHRELTGRENILLNGSILGMKRAEIVKKFDEIVAFAEVEKFIDTPVKFYSSGMYVRLAFAVAAHLEPEILVVDEVLAVGDAAFQKKCVGKMGDVAKQGRTVLFVSHNMGIVGEIAERGIWLNQGQMLYDGKVGEAISHYLSSGQTLDDSVADLSNHPNRLPGMRQVLRRISCKKANGTCSPDFFQADDIVIVLEYADPQEARLAGAGFIIYTAEGVKVGGVNTYMASLPPHRLPQAGAVTFIVPARQLTPGNYRLTVSLGSHQGTLEDKIESALGFVVHPSDIYGTGYLLTREDGVAALSVQASVHACESKN